MTMLEKAAGALLDRAGYTEYGPIVPESLAADLARAVLTAVRDPDETEMQQMTEAYGAAFAAAFAVRYRAVIDAILSEPQP